MNADKFVEAIQKVSFEGAIESTIKNLAEPPGQDPPRYLVKLSQWFKGLDAGDQSAVEEVARLAAAHAVLSFLCVLDGAEAVAPPPLRFELYAVTDGERILLNEVDKEPLNDKFRG